MGKLVLRGSAGASKQGLTPRPAPKKGWHLFRHAATLQPEDIVPGLCFRQRDDSVWEVVRLVRFQVHPLPHVELVKVRAGPAELTQGRKVISISALLDPSLYSLEPQTAAAAE